MKTAKTFSKSFKISYHNGGIIFHNMCYALDLFPSTAYHSIIVCVLYTHLHLWKLLPSTIYISLTIMVDVQTCCRWWISSADKTTVRWQWIRLNTFGSFSPMYVISHLGIYAICHVILQLQESYSNGASTMKTAITFSNLSKCHTIAAALYSIICATH